MTYADGVDPLIIKVLIFGLAATSSMDLTKVAYRGTASNEV